MEGNAYWLQRVRVGSELHVSLASSSGLTFASVRAWNASLVLRTAAAGDVSVWSSGH